ncbi:MAG TPA: IS30 family transposase [Candidatus Bacteroides avicola]|uniref:IS30 family transposase n=1 Tax=Candidatus Bacteroides avicola TaxID=2838468 RepID=A0A9D2HW05_9BACE|nr:IS30 family transposase [Candidatus Bacteroides avicola]
MYKHLTREQRYGIYLGKQKGETLEIIARSIGVHKSTVSREVKRNSTPNGSYVWNKAHDMAESRQRHSPGNRGLAETLKWRVTELIKTDQWSPRQISGRLRMEGINISHEAIYGLIRKDESGELASHCRHKMKYKRKAYHRHETKATNIRNRISIHQRPVEAYGSRFGDWEMDLIVDKDSNAILTLTERSTNFLLMEKLKQGKKAGPVAKAVWRLLLPYKGEALKSITTDNGSEFAEHEWITRKLNVSVYFADSYCAWQKGAIENANKLVRQYIPKGTDISTVTEGKIAKIRKKINARPREKLNFLTPKEVFFKNIS